MGGGSLWGGAGRVRALQREVEGVKTIMSQNVERILARGENLEQLHSKSQDLEATLGRGSSGQLRVPKLSTGS
uniref:V-SNARE coiled-coil homology domain-containing protein n=1 Tax=Otus sunia TaxID=257818 RepID=A0A8C8AEW3_9STRI